MQKKTESRNPRVGKTNKGKLMHLSRCGMCDGKTSRFIKKQEASGLLSNFGLKTPFSKIPLLEDILF